MPLFKRIASYLVAVVGTLVLLVTLLSLFTVSVWWLQVLDFFRFQALILHALVLLGLVLLGWQRHKIARLLLLAGTVAGLALQAHLLLPYAPLAARPVPDATPAQAADLAGRLRLLEINVYMKNRKAAPLLQLVRDVQPDVLLAVETDQWWVQALGPLQPHYPYRLELPHDNTYGLVLYSRLPLVDPQEHMLQQKNVPSIRTGLRLPNGRVVTLYGVHPTPPFPDNYPNSVGMKDVALRKLGRMVKQETRPALVCGDFNDVSWSHTTRMFGVDGELYNVNLGRGLFNTFDAHWLPIRWSLDHLFVTKEFRLVELKRLPSIDSDHFPLYAELVLVE
ncbi:endonuclease/exonuclease/phosphatase family protein [Hymenobacter sp. BT507]|uniref:Endonuclease/exonuclease/phosphatase family protein n=1 Tax=Hymenobacter citatus TaxID=2763506 RepID=A0ABR7MEG9_9BACT|nr:endonuclease/exonuclease/phosphatase family protein [Hymenobacter citatus]MBC6609461.1 endonuclease/exonuclease/phosphatase family protein [Hymenobacter citatus]